MFLGRLGAAVMGAVAFFALSTTERADAQTLDGCTLINNGAFNQMPLSGIGTTITQTLVFNAGDIITVTIMNATNSLAVIGPNVLLSGQTGNVTVSFMVTTAGLVTVQGDVQGIGSKITFMCTPAPTTTPTTGSGGGLGALIGTALQNEEQTAENANENAKLPKSNAGLGTTFDEPQSNLQALKEQLEQAEKELAKEQKRLADTEKKLAAAKARQDDAEVQVALLNSAAQFELEKVTDELLAELRRSQPELTRDRVRLIFQPELSASQEYNIASFSGTPAAVRALSQRDEIADRYRNRRRDATIRFEFLTERVVEPLQEARKFISDNVEGLQSTIEELRAQIARGGAVLGQDNSGSIEHHDGDIVLFTQDSPTSITVSLDSSVFEDPSKLAAFGDEGVSFSQNPDDFKVWVKARLTRHDGDQEGVDGNSGEVLFGAVYRVAPRWEVGAFGSLFSSDLTTNHLGLQVVTTSITGGLYTNYLFDFGILAGLSASYELGAVDTTRPGASANYGYDQLQLSASATGVVDAGGGWVLTPSLAGTLSYRSDEEHLDTAGILIPEDNRLDVFALGSLAAARTYRVNQGPIETFTPTGVITGTWYLTDRGQATADRSDVTFGGGASLGMSDGATLAFTGFVGGFGQATQTYGGQLLLQMPL